jgi:hypothetical protein
MCEIYDDGERCKVWEEWSRTARKSHVCSCCGGGIAKGDAYHLIRSLFDGQWDGEKMCFKCWCAREQFSEAHDGHIARPSMLPDLLRECIDNAEDFASKLRWSRVLKRVSA